MRDEDYDLIDDQSRAFLKEPMKTSKYLLWAILGFVSLILIWAYFAKLDERTTATGRVVPSSRIQTIQNLEGGILKQLLVQEGDTVEKGDILAKIDDTRFKSTSQENLVKYNALLSKLIRLKAEELDADSVEFPQELIDAYPEFVENEKRLFDSNRANHLATLEVLRKNLEIAQRKVEISKPLAEEGVISELEALRHEKEASEAAGKLIVEEETYKSNINEQIVDVKSEIDSLNETLEGLKDRINRTNVRSPVKGIVTKIDINTIGGVIQPGEAILEIVPIGEVLLIEAKVPPNKIAFIRVGQEASVKITAYDSSIYGSLEGKVKYISADAIVEQEGKDEEDQYYKLVVETNRNYLEYQGEKLPIIPGMQATVDILTGEKTVLEYLLNPFIKAKDKAFTER